MTFNIGNKEKRLFFLVAAAFIFAVVVPTTLGDYALQYREEQRGNRSSVESRIRQLEQDLGSIEDKRSQVRRYIKSYRELMSRNVLGAPDTVALVKEMRTIRTERRQSAIDFKFDPGVILTGDSVPTAEGSSIDVRVHPMEINMKMLHDLDMFMFMESLHDRVSTVSFPVRCSFELLHTGFVIKNRENLDASCQINWYSVNDPDANTDAAKESASEAEAETVQS